MIFLPRHKGIIYDESIVEEKIVQGISLDKLIIEPSKFDEWQYFNESLNRLKDKGWKRHPRPVEIMTVLIDYLEKGDRSRYAVLAKSISKDMSINNMVSDKGEWLSGAFRKRGNFVDVALDPENFVCRNNIYVVDGGNLVSGGVKTFDIGNKRSREWIYLGDFPDDFVMYLYGRNFKNLPREMRENDNTRVLFREDNFWWPIGRNCNRYGIIADFVVTASRGVRTR